MPSDRLEILMDLLEDEILDAPDDALLAHSDAATTAGRVRLIISGLTRLAPSSKRPTLGNSRHDRRRTGGRARNGRRNLVHRLMVASASARSELGDRTLESLSETELDALFARLDAVGLVPSLGNRPNGED